MTTVLFLAEWALRSSILILSGALMLRVFRVKDPSIRLASWIAILFGSLAIPAINTALPKITLVQIPLAHGPMSTLRSAAPDMEATPVAREATPPQLIREAARPNPEVALGFEWAQVAAGIYVLVAGTLLLRLCAGLAMSRRLLRASRATGRMMQEIEIRESDGVTAPVTLGIIRSTIVLPSDWREWDGTKLDAVVEHELSHIRRRDPAVQMLSAIHRALVWHSPMSWFLDQRIVRAAEEASDDAALAVTRDRESYAEVLLEFMQRGVRGANLPDAKFHGVAMARYSQPGERISRILDGASLSRGLTRWSMLAILACGSPLAYMVGAAETQEVAPTPPQAPIAPAAPSGPASAPLPPFAPAPPQPATAPAAPQSPTPRSGRSIRRYMIVSSDSSISGSWDSGEEADVQELRERFGQRFAWFRQGRNEYVVTDAGVLAELEEAMAPQKEVNRMQSDVNKQQDLVNQHQAKVNQAQDDVNAIQARANRRQELINELQAAKGDDDLVRKLEAALTELRANKGETGDQDAANREQAKVNEMQGRVNEEQGKVNERQHKVNEEQSRVSSKYAERIDEILDSAVRRNFAQSLK